MQSRTRRKYTPKFKRKAVELASQPGQRISQVAANLGIGPGLIQRWKRELSDHGQQAFIGQRVARDEELVVLRRELSQVKKERDFLKSATTYFAKDAK
jgi:transposase